MGEQEYKIGDVVRLKSGGPAMTIIEVEGTSLTCLWFAEDKSILRAVLDKAVVNLS